MSETRVAAADGLRPWRQSPGRLCFFGRLQGEPNPTVSEDGCPAANANDWAKMMEADLLQLAEIESGRELLGFVARF